MQGKSAQVSLSFKIPQGNGGEGGSVESEGDGAVGAASDMALTSLFATFMSWCC